MILGLKMLLHSIPISLMGFVIFGQVINHSVNYITSLIVIIQPMSICAPIAIILSLITIGMTWVYYRPTIGYSLLAGAAFITLGSIVLIRKMIATKKSLPGLDMQQNQLKPTTTPSNPPEQPKQEDTKKDDTSTKF